MIGDIIKLIFCIIGVILLTALQLAINSIIPGIVIFCGYYFKFEFIYYLGWILEGAACLITSAQFINAISKNDLMKK